MSIETSSLTPASDPFSQSAGFVRFLKRFWSCWSFSRIEVEHSACVRVVFPHVYVAVAQGKLRVQIDREIKTKERAVEMLAQKYSSSALRYQLLTWTWTWTWTESLLVGVVTFCSD